MRQRERDSDGSRRYCSREFPASGRRAGPSVRASPRRTADGGRRGRDFPRRLSVTGAGPAKPGDAACRTGLLHHRLFRARGDGGGGAGAAARRHGLSALPRCCLPDCAQPAGAGAGHGLGHAAVLCRVVRRPDFGRAAQGAGVKAPEHSAANLDHCLASAQGGGGGLFDWRGPALAARACGSGR